MSLALLLLVAFLSARPAFAQVATGAPIYGSFSGGPDVVNNANLNVHLPITVHSKAGRGLPFSNTLSFESSIWYPAGTSGQQYWAQLPYWGWNGIINGATGYLYATQVGGYCSAGGYWGYTILGPYVDAGGTPHNVSLTELVSGGYAQCGISLPPSIPIATDGSGYTLEYKTDTRTATIHPRSGGSIIPPVFPGNLFNFGPWSSINRNGNEITIASSSGSSAFTDTLGTTALTVSGSGTPSSPITFQYTAASGNQATVTMNYAAYTVQTDFGCSGITEFGATAENLVSSIVYPDGTSYSFTYEVTPGDNHNPHYVTGRPASVTLPTGGTISYTYSGGSNGITCADGSAATLERTTPDGAWTYAHTENGTAWTTTLTDPQSNVTTYNFQGIYETERQVAGLETIYTCYNGASFPCNGTSVSLPITQRTVTTSLGGLESQVNTDYDPTYGMVTEVDEYNYGNGAVGSLARKTTATYWNPAKSYIKGLPVTVSLYNGAGTLLHQTVYTYDALGLTSTSGTPQFTNPGGARGNPTSIALSGSGFGTISKSISYFDTGNRHQATDFNSAVTTYNSGWGACGNSFDTTIGLPMSLSRSLAWDCNGALTKSTTDANNNTTSFSYDDMNRLTHTSFPDGGVRNTQYTSATVTDVCTLISGSLTGCTPGSGSVVRHDETVLDGLGRTIHQDLVSDPSGETYVDTAYDSLGRAYTESNPYRSTSDPTYGVDTYSYDALSRVTRVTHSDSSYSQVAYGNGAQLCSASTYGYGYPVLNTDESSNQRRSFTDALGRVIEVDEPDPSNGNSLTLSTCYTYDAQGSLTGVVQGSETRSYSYDGLSRMTQSTTPEGGTTHYYFTTSGGALCANNQKLVCRKTDARGITTTYIYDALDRLTGKSYSNGDASIAYYYDQTSYNGLTITNGLGQRTGMHDASGQTAWSYDKMGRTIAEERTIGTVTKTMSYGYELDGSLASITYPGGRIVSYTYGSDSRPISAVDSANSINYVTGATYAPPGGLAGMVEGEVSGGFAGITTSNGFNSRLFPTLLSASSSNGTALSLSYSYFANGNVNVETNGRDNGRSVTYTYDALNRVSTAASQATSGSDCWGQSFGYDRYANLTTINVTQCTAPMLSLSVNTNNQITNASFNYDAAGDLTGDGIYTYSWNAERHLTSAANVTYAYDGNLQRVKKSSGTLYWHSPAGVPLAETDPSGNTLNEYVYFGSARVARRDSSGNVYYYFEDHLGTATTLSNASGVLCYDADFLPFGSELTHIASCAQNYKFTGLERDAETGLDHTKFRKYDSSFGRWLTPDPKAGSPANPQSWNRYAYARDNPTNNVDPLGLYPCPSNCTFYEDEGPGYCVCDPEPGGFGGSGGGPCENIVMAGSFVRPNVMGCEPRGGNGGPRRLVDSATNKWAHNLLKSVWGEFSTGNCLGKIAAVFNAVFKSQGLSYSTSDFLAKANSTCFYDANNPTFGNLTENYVTSGQVLGDAGSTTLQTALANYDAITLNSGPGNQAVVAVSQNFLNTATGWDVLHEALHAYTGWSDAQIEGTFHITPANDYGDSSAISKWLQNGCP